MPTTELNTDVALGVAIPSRNARGRIARLGPSSTRSSPTTTIRRVIEKLLAEALTLTALLGSLLKEPQGQLTLQAQTEGGIIDLMVCDYLGGELRGYVRHDPERLADAVQRRRRCRSCSARAISRSPSTSRSPRSATRASCRWRARTWREAAQSYFAQSEQIPSLVRLAAEKRDGHWFAGGLLLQHLARGRGGPRAAAHAARPSRLAACRDPRRVGEGGGADRSRRFRSTTCSGACSTRRTRCGRWRRLPLRRGCRCDPDYVRSVIARFPADEREAMVGDDGLIRVDCAFCSSSFAIEPAELD